MQTQLRTISVVFNSSPGRTYDYFVPEGDNPKIGDTVITSVNNGMTAHGLATEVKSACVKAVHSATSDKATKFYLMILPNEELEKKAEANRAFAAKLAERKRAITKLEELAKVQDRMAIYEELAKNNPEAQALLAILKD